MFDVKTIKRVATGIVASFAFAGAASAATLSVVGGTSSVLPSDFSASVIGGPAPLPAVGDPITSFSGNTPFGAGEGLQVSGDTQLKYTFMGKEAYASNSVVSIGGATLTNTGTVGSSFTVNQTGGLVSFLFSTLETIFEDINSNGTYGESLAINNGGASSFGGLHMAFSSVFNGGTSVLVFFGDGRGDADFDDMVIRIDAVPLPASALMLLGGLGGLGALRARKKKTA